MHPTFKLYDTITLGRPTAGLGQKSVWVGQARIWVGHGLPGLIARTARKHDDDVYCENSLHTKRDPCQESRSAMHVCIAHH